MNKYKTVTLILNPNVSIDKWLTISSYKGLDWLNPRHDLGQVGEVRSRARAGLQNKRTIVSGHDKAEPQECKDNRLYCKLLYNNTLFID